MSTGKFVWYDFNAKDVEKAVAFYTETVGWKTQDWEGSSSDMPYTMLVVDGQPIGGVTQLPDEAAAAGAPAHWIAYISVDDVDAAVEKAKGLDADVMAGPMDIPEVGRFAVLADPQGATFAIYRSSGEETEQPSPDTEGAFSWHELYTSDLEGAWDFYTEMFGWENTDSMDMGDAGEYRMYGHGKENTYGGIMNKPDEFPMSAWVYYINVDDIDDAISRVESHGGQKLNGPMEVPGGGKVAQFMDNQGAVFAFFAFDAPGESS